MKWVFIVIAALLALIAAGVAAYFLVPGIRSSEPESTARYFPDDVLVYSWATLNPGVAQGRHMLDIWEHLEDIPEFQESIDDLLDEFEDDTGIDFESEILPWLGPDISFAVLDTRDFESVDAVAMFGVQDYGAASDFLDDRLDYLEDEEDMEFEDDSIGDFDVWADEDEQQIYALSKDWLVFATTEDALDEVLDRISGDGGESLTDVEGFQQARALMSDPRVMSFYVDLEGVMHVLPDVSGVGLMPGTGMDGLLGIPDWIGVSARFVDRGLVVEAVSPSGSEFAAGFPGIGEPATLLPDDTLGLIAASFDPDLDNWRAELEEYTLADLGFPNDAEYIFDEIETSLSDSGIQRELSVDSTVAEILDIVVSSIDILTGIHPEKDLLDYLGGQVIFSLRVFNFDRVEDFGEYAVDATIMLSYVPADEEDLVDTLDKASDLLESSAPIEQRSVDVGAEEDAIVFDLRDMMGETAYSPGYVFHDGYLTIGSTEDALESIVDVQKGEGDALGDAPEYQRIREHLPDEMQGLMFVDLRRIIAQVDPDDVGMDSTDYEILEETFSAVAIGSSIDAEHSRTVSVLTLFPE